AVLDLGVKKSTLENLAARGLDVHVLPQQVTAEHVLSLNPSALFFSNGPGDPQASDKHGALLQETLRAGLPYFGICFGNQLLGRALGLTTYKL
ncbi:glutamine amidotransferase-related protein, partial [Aeromonas veronii]|uniref:glutamine amidotransferase-related protein n=1 Tax=Aeromonas veronii TaxID=654 RepID=UPI003D1945E2